MTKDEALNLARTALGVQLDALLGKAGHLRNDERRRYAENGIKAIDEALAQPEQETLAWEQFYPDIGKPQLAPPHPWEKFCDSNCVWTDHHPDCKLAQPDQEPVAWMYTSQWKGDEKFITRYQSELMTYKADKVWPLYTTSPPCQTCEAMARTVMMDQTGRDA